jgi:hypothetical protein
MSILKKAHEITKNTVAFFAARKEKISYQATFVLTLKELKKNPDFMPVYTDISDLSAEEKMNLIMTNCEGALPEIVALTVREATSKSWFGLLNAYNKRNQNRENSYRTIAYYEEKQARDAAAAVVKKIREEAWAIFEKYRPRLEHKNEASFEKKGDQWFVRAIGKQTGDTVIVITATKGKTKRIVLGAKVPRSKDLFEVFSQETIENRMIYQAPDLTGVKAEVKKVVLELIENEIKDIEIKLFKARYNVGMTDWQDYKDFVESGNRADDY